MPSIDLKDQYFGCEIEMTGLTRQQAAEAVASLFGTNAVHSRSSRTYDPWEVTDNEGKTWRFVYDSSIHGSHRTGRQQIPIGDGDYKVEMNSPKLEYSERENCRKLSVPCVMRGLLSMEAAVCTSMWTLLSIHRRA